MRRFIHPGRLGWLLVALAAAGAAGCVHIPPQPALNHSSGERAIPLPPDCGAWVGNERVSGATREALSAERISLLNWNVFKQSRGDWRSDFEQLSHDKDLLVLQEVRMEESLDSVLSEFPYHWLMAEAFYYQDRATGVLTASRARSIKYCALYAREPLIQTPKSILLSAYALTGTDLSLLVANVHGINFSAGLESYRAQFEALGEVLRGHRGPLILAGDFNTWSEERRSVLEGLAKALSLRQVGYEAHHRTTVFGKPVDHVYFRGLDLVEARSPLVTSSDHNPLLVEFRLADTGHEHYAKKP